MARPWLVEELKEAAEKDLANAREKGAPEHVIAELEEIISQSSDLASSLPGEFQNLVERAIATKPPEIPMELGLHLMGKIVAKQLDPLVHDILLDVIEENIAASKNYDTHNNKIALAMAMSEGKKILA